MSEETKLKPCPFCGGTDIGKFDEDDGMNPRVECYQCGSGASCYCDTIEQAIKSWNTRPTETEAWEAAREKATIVRFGEELQGHEYRYKTPTDWEKQGKEGRREVMEDHKPREVWIVIIESRDEALSGLEAFNDFWGAEMCVHQMKEDNHDATYEIFKAVEWLK